MASSDDEWLPPPKPKQKPKNWAMLKGKKKKGNLKAKVMKKCSECLKSFISTDHLKNHIKSVHGIIFRLKED
jgi:hypothetical protein